MTKQATQFLMRSKQKYQKQLQKLAQKRQESRDQNPKVSSDLIQRTQSYNHTDLGSTTGHDDSLGDEDEYESHAQVRRTGQGKEVPDHDDRERERRNHTKKVDMPSQSKKCWR